MTNTTANRVHTRCRKTEYVHEWVFTGELSRYALKQLTVEQKVSYHKHLAEQEKTLYGEDGVRVEIYRDGNEWVVTGFDPDDYQDSDNRADSFEDAILIGEEMIFDLEEMYCE